MTANGFGYCEEYKTCMAPIFAKRRIMVAKLSVFVGIPVFIILAAIGIYFARKNGLICVPNT